MAEEEPTCVSGLVPGGKNDTSVLGDVEEARTIAERALDVVKRFSDAIIRQDLETAYALCANELRGWMSVKRFYTELQEADAEYGGRPIEYTPQRITWIYVSESSRKRGNKNGEWPKETPKQNKRALVGGWWTAEKTPAGEEYGRSVFFWVTEEAEGYRVAKFRQYHQ